MVDGSLCSMWRPVSWSLDPQIRLLRFYRIFHGFGSFVSTWWIHLVTRCLTVIKISLNVNETCHNPCFQKAISHLLIILTLLITTITVVDLTITLTSTVHQDCVVMRSNSGSLGQWAHVGCSKTDINFVCERKPTC